MIAVILLIGISIWLYSFLTQNQNKTANIVTQEQSTKEITSSKAEYPLFLTTMTHMEGSFNDDRLEDLFLSHVEELRYGMDLADEYNAILTIESEKPFAIANTTWGINIMKEILDRGHGVGTHCDFGANEEIPTTLLTEMFKENKELIDELVGSENNHGCSGGGGPGDWITAATNAGFDYVNGIVSMHLLAIEEEGRPDKEWSNAHIEKEFHENIPEDIMDRIYPIKLKDTMDWENDEDGIIVISNGELGTLPDIEENYDQRTECKGSCELNTDDIDELFNIIQDVNRERDKTKVAKLNIYIPVNMFEQENEDILRYFFSRMQELQTDDIMKWASQWEVVETYLNQ